MKFEDKEREKSRRKKKKKTRGGKNLEKDLRSGKNGGIGEGCARGGKRRRRKVRGARIPSSRSRRLEEESRWEEIGGRSRLAVHRLVHRPAGRSTSDASHHRDTLMQRARKCRPRCPLCVSATTTRISNFDRVSPLCSALVRSIRNGSRFEAVPRFDPSFNPVRFTRATGKSCPSIDRGGVKKEYTSRNASISTRAAVFFPSSVRSMLDARFDRFSSLSSIAQRWWTRVLSHFPVPSVCSLRFRIHRYVSDLQDRV